MLRPNSHFRLVRAVTPNISKNDKSCGFNGSEILKLMTIVRPNGSYMALSQYAINLIPKKSYSLSLDLKHVDQTSKILTQYSIST